MRWTERQRAMLREMGVRLWLPGDGAADDVVVDTAPVVAAAVAAEPRVAPSPSPSRRTLERGSDAPRVPGLAPADWLVVADPLDPADPQHAQLLDNILRAIGVGLVAPGRERRAVFLAVDATAAGAAAERGAADEARLRAALDAVAPRCILAFGRAASAALLGADAPLGGLRGRVHDYAGVPVVVTFSLAFLLRHPAEKAKAWADLCLAVRTLAAPAAA